MDHGGGFVLSPVGISVRRVSAGRCRRFGMKMMAATGSLKMTAWAPDSWKEKVAGVEINEGLVGIVNLPPLVYAGEIDRLKKQLVRVQNGHAFLLQAGDREEDFAQTQGNSTESTFRLLVAQVIILAYYSGMPVVKVGHHPGDFEQVGPYKVVTDGQADEVTRSYYQASSTLNLLRAVAKSTTSMLEWLEFIREVSGTECDEFLKHIENALCFVRAAGLDVTNEEFREPEFYSAHELFLLPYEEGLSREEGGKWYGTSAHMFYIQQGAGRLESAHIEFLRGIENPISIRVDTNTSNAELIELIRAVNPKNENGRITVVTSFGAATVWNKLATMISDVGDAGLRVTWTCDPMKENTLTTANGCLSCPVDLVLAEIAAFFTIHVQEGTIPGGVYLDMTGADVSECIGGVASVKDSDVFCEAAPDSSPRLNSKQALQVAFDVGKRLQAVMRPGERLRTQ